MQHVVCDSRIWHSSSGHVAVKDSSRHYGVHPGRIIESTCRNHFSFIFHQRSTAKFPSLKRVRRFRFGIFMFSNDFHLAQNEMTALVRILHRKPHITAFAIDFHRICLLIILRDGDKPLPHFRIVRRFDRAIQRLVNPAQINPAEFLFSPKIHVNPLRLSVCAHPGASKCLRRHQIHAPGLF